ncbi:acyltransferase family protein [Sphingomonas sp. IC081]|uniref:acyltransferase family protein n=1 Tax=Sphingomonas sp. IC081 TaxID=304378 RepID=UPI001157F5ED|nr:acyltransferase [Sphingomonas sp. IC081]QDK33684.1 hypothetical protein DM450_13050 [Sphingomonas sp. IC081]
MDGCGMAERDSTGHFGGLDGLRGVAAMAVAANHAYRLLGFQLLAHGYMAVDFFFILSGFVISHAYQERLRGGMTLGRFVQARVDRLYPMVILGVGAGALALVLGLGFEWSAVLPAAVLQVLLLPAPFLHAYDDFIWPLNPPAWSLFWEVLASLAFGLGLFRLGNRVLAGIFLGFALWLGAAALRWSTVEVGYVAANALEGLPRTAVSFTLGMLIWRGCKAGLLDRLRNRPAPALWLVAALLMAVFLIPGRSGYVDMLLILVILPGLLLAGVLCGAASGVWNWAGRISYPLYLVHFPILFAIEPFVRPDMSAVERGLWFAGYLLAALVGGWLAAVCWDEPVRRALRRWRKARAAAPGGGVPAPEVPVPLGR